MNDHVVSQFHEVFGNRIRPNESLAKYCALKIGGTASLLLEVDTTNDLIKAVQLAVKTNTKWKILGGGTNTVSLDKVFHGIVIKNNCRKFDVMRVSGRITRNTIAVSSMLVYAESGAITNQVVRFTLDEGLEGLESFLGIPGTIGGAFYSHAHWQAKTYFSDRVYQVTLITDEGELVQVDQKTLATLSVEKRRKCAIVSVIVKLHKADKKELWQKGMDIVAYRNAHEPQQAAIGYLFSDINLSDAMRIPTPGNSREAEKLIAMAHLRGKSIGGAMIAQKHGNFILDTGNATAEDIQSLLRYVQEKIKKIFGVELVLGLTIL